MSSRAHLAPYTASPESVEADRAESRILLSLIPNGSAQATTGMFLTKKRENKSQSVSIKNYYGLHDIQKV